MDHGEQTGTKSLLMTCVLLSSGCATTNPPSVVANAPTTTPPASVASAPTTTSPPTPPAVPDTAATPSLASSSSPISSGLKSVFAGSVASAVGGSNNLTSVARSQMGGSITDWYHQSAKTPASQPRAPSLTPPPAAPASPAAVASTTPAAPPTSAVPANNAASSPASTPASHPDSSMLAAAPTEPKAYAGIAYEIHLLTTGNKPVAVDPKYHHFKTGDRFRVPFRPALSGIVDVYNVDPNGVSTKIDSTQMAAGELLTLGTYAFVAGGGDETLRLVLLPCETPTLVATTRSIVRQEDVATAPHAERPAERSLAVPLQSCRVATTSPLPGTRGIVKIDTDGATAFALDPATTEESRTGKYAPREVVVHLIHD
jgi:hypothetical protein